MMNNLTEANPKNFNAVNVLIWNKSNSIGQLPGSSLKFKLNEFGSLELIDKNANSTRSIIVNTNQNLKTNSTDQSDKQQIENQPVINGNKFSSPSSIPSSSTATTATTTIITTIPAITLTTIPTSTTTNNNNTLNSSSTTACSTCGLRKASNSLIKLKYCSQTCLNLAVKRGKKKKRSTKNLNQLKTNLVSRTELDKAKTANNHHQSSIKTSKTASSSLQTSSNQNSNQNSNQKSFIKLKRPVDNLYKQNKNKSKSKFTWKKYLDDTESIAAPAKCFKQHQISTKQNYFKVGNQLEAIDPQHPSLFCVASVVEVCGHRMRIHFDGYNDRFDFWLNCDSPFIFHVGFCAKTNRKLQPPKNHDDQFEWASYMQQSKTKAAPKHCFYWYNKQLNQPSGFKVGMKLEAVDKANQSLTCVATINDILGDWLLIHFDGWDSSYDYWTQVSSPYIHSIGWCKSKGKLLTPPKNYAKLDEFDWQDYLKETNSSCVISNQFKCRPANTFKLLMKLEVVDRRNPRYLRPATIINKTSHSIKVNFDGWPEKYNLWYDDDSPDLHPVNWCLQANNSYFLEPKQKRKLSKCQTIRCNGIGHLHNPNLRSHKSPENCPYTDDNLNYQLPDRFGESSEIYVNSDTQSSYSLEISSLNTNNSNPRSFSLRSQSQSFLDSYNMSSEYGYEETDLEAFKEFWIGVCRYAERLDAGDFLEWEVEKIASFVDGLLPTFNNLGTRFREQCIDGESFLLLTFDDLVKILDIKVKYVGIIYDVICILRKNLSKPE